MQSVVHTDAGRWLRNLANGEHRDEGAVLWQENLLKERIEEHRYSYVEGSRERLEGRAARARYYARLEEEPVGSGGRARA